MEERSIYVRRARVVDVEAVLSVLNAAYAVEMGNSDRGFRLQPRYQNSEQVQSDILLARQEENIGVFFVAAEKRKRPRRQSDQSDPNGKSGSSSATASTGANGSSVVKSISNAIGSVVKSVTVGSSSNKTDEAAGDTMVHGRLLLNSESTTSIGSGSGGTCSPGQTTPGGSRETIVGAVRVMLRKFGGDKCIDLSPYGVHPSYQRQGIGSLLLQASYDWALKRSVRRVVLEVCSLRSDLFLARPGSKDENFGVTDPRSTANRSSLTSPSSSAAPTNGKKPLQLPAIHSPGSTTTQNNLSIGGGGLGLSSPKNKLGNNNFSSGGGSSSSTAGAATTNTASNTLLQSPSSPANGQKKNKTSLPWTQAGATAAVGSNAPSPPPLTGAAAASGNKKGTESSTNDMAGATPSSMKTSAASSSPGANKNGASSTVLSPSNHDKNAPANGISSDVETFKRDPNGRITSKEIEAHAKSYPDLKRPIPGQGFFGKMGYVQVGAISSDDVLDPEPGSTARPCHFLLLSRNVPLAQK
ncbi:unnamed protein product [Amoebophrya sp. A120]|nr:unnamed protein product [Amoebophrya sp. A120]|eukprot:GSA120T00020215001.1